MALAAPAVAHNNCAVLQAHGVDSNCVVAVAVAGEQAAGTEFVVDKEAAGTELVVA